MSVVQFDPPYRGQDAESHFPRMILAVDMATRTVLVMDEDGFLHAVPIAQVQTDFRWNPNQKTWVSIDDPDPEEG